MDGYWRVRRERNFRALAGCGISQEQGRAALQQGEPLLRERVKMPAANLPRLHHDHVKLARRRRQPGLVAVDALEQPAPRIAAPLAWVEADAVEEFHASIRASPASSGVDGIQPSVARRREMSAV